MSFLASYPGACEAGDDQIRPGDRIVTDGFGYSHLRCIQIDDEPATPPRRPPTTERKCGQCHLVHAGECF